MQSTQIAIIKKSGICTLSKDGRQMALRTRHDEVSKHIRSTLITLLTFVGYCVITLSASDRTLLENDWRLRLPIFGATVPIEHFMLVAPALLLALFLYLNRLIRHKQLIEERLDRREDAVKDQGEVVLYRYPAAFNFGDPITSLISDFLFYALTPLVLFFFWYRATKMAQEAFLLITLMTVAAVGLATALYFLQRRGSRLLFIVMSVATVLLISAALAIIGSRDRSPYRWDFSHANLAGKNLYGRDLSKLKFRHAVLDDAILMKTVLSDSDLTSASMERANLKYSILWRAVLQGAHLHEARASQTDFGEGAILEGAKFHGADLGGSHMPKANLRGSGLRGDLSWAILNDADLTEADVLGAKMVGIELNRATLVDTTLEKAVLIKAQLESADLTGAGLHNARLHGARLQNSRLRRANLSAADFSPLEDASDFPWASYKYGREQYRFPLQQYHGPVPSADLTGADLSGADITSAKIQGVDLSQTKGLTAEQLMSALGNDKTVLPKYLANLEEEIRKSWSAASSPGTSSP
jgi:uncharacterized protein YjbI with pentapeptide repeats